MTERGAQAEPRGWVLGLLAFVVGGLAIAGFLSLEGRGAPRAPASGPPSPSEPAELAAMDTAQLQALVDARPSELLPRLRLAHRYLDARDSRRALEHYMAALELDPSNAEALAHAGWIAFESGDAETAERLVSSSLEKLPDGAEALWFLANIRLYGRNDPAGALKPLETLRARPDLSADFRQQVERLIQLGHAAT